MKNPPKKLTDAILDSVDNNPGQWVFSDFTASHAASGVEVWIANGRWGMSITIRPRSRDDFGGVVMLALAPWRYQIFAAVKRAMAGRPNRYEVAADRAITALRATP